MKKFLLPIILLFIVGISCGGDTELPNVGITNPTDGASVTGTVNITVSATDNEGVERVELYINDTLVATLTNTPYAYEWETSPLPDSSIHVIHAKAFDDAGNEGASPSVTVTVRNFQSAAPIFIWLFDPAALLYDSVAGGWIDCAYWIEQGLSANGYDFDKATVLPNNLDSIDVIFVALGWRVG